MTNKKGVLIGGLVAVVVVIGVVFLVPSENQLNKNTKKIDVVCVFPMTGPGASLGDFLQKGVELGEEKIERNTDVEINVKILDSKNKPKVAVSALRSEIARDKPDVVLSGLSSVSSAIAPIVEKNDILTAVTTTALSELPKGKENIFRLYPTSKNYVEPVARYINQQHEDMAVLYVNDDFGNSNKEAFAKIVKEEGGNIVYESSYGLTQSDFKTTVNKIKNTDADSVFVTGYGPAFISLFLTLKESAKYPKIYSEIGFANPNVLESLGKTANGIVFDGTKLELAKSNSDSVEKYRKQYKSKFETEPYMVAGFATDALGVIVEAAQKGGGFSIPNKDNVISVSPYNGVMGSIRLDKSGDSHIKLMLMKREEGRNVPVENND